MTIPHLRRLTGLLALVAASALAVALVAPTVDAASVAHGARAKAHAKSCDISKVADALGPTSVTSLKVTRTTCKKGIAVVKAFHRCRLKHGTSGRCVKLVKGYACAEIRSNGPTQFSANVTCRKDGATVSHHYTQTI
jgi:hypothetical protein